MSSKNERNTGGFKKQDGEKNRLELIEPNFILGLGKVLTFGAEKYAPHNWKRAKPKDVERINGAMLRHMMAYMSGEVYDPETGLQHMHHIACNTMFLAYHTEQMEEVATTCITEEHS